MANVLTFHLLHALRNKNFLDKRLFIKRQNYTKREPSFFCFFGLSHDWPSILPWPWHGLFVSVTTTIVWQGLHPHRKKQDLSSTKEQSGFWWCPPPPKKKKKNFYKFHSMRPWEALLEVFSRRAWVIFQSINKNWRTSASTGHLFKDITYNVWTAVALIWF